MFKTLSDRECKAYLKLKAEQIKQSAGPATQMAQPKSAPQRTHRVQDRHGGWHDDADPDSSPLAFCVEEAARMIGVSRATLYVLISTGDLRTIKIRKRRLVPREALLDLLATGVA